MGLGKEKKVTPGVFEEPRSRIGKRREDKKPPAKGNVD